MPSRVLAPEWLQWQLAEREPCLPSLSSTGASAVSETQMKALAPRISLEGEMACLACCIVSKCAQEDFRIRNPSIQTQLLGLTVASMTREAEVF